MALSTPARPSRLSASWLDMLAKYMAFAAEHKRDDVAYIKQFDKKLANWVNRCKSAMTQHTLSAKQALHLQAAGMAPSVKTVKCSRQEARNARETTLEELVAYVADHGHSQLPPREDPTSLFQRVRKLRHIANGRKDAKLIEELTRLGAYHRYPTWEWESGFAAWRAYTAASGDYAGVADAPTDVQMWLSMARSQVLRYAGPLDSKSVAISRACRDFKEECAGIRRALPRLAAAGFLNTPPVLSEWYLLASKAREACLGRTAAAWQVPVRSALRILAIRHQQNKLTSLDYARLQSLGFVWCDKQRRWTLQVGAHHILGSFVRTPEVPVIRAVLAEEKQPRKSKSTIKIEETAKQAHERARGDNALLRLHNIPLLYEVKNQMQSGFPSSEWTLLLRPQIQKFRGNYSYKQFKTELRLVVSILHDLEWLEYLPGELPFDEMSLFQCRQARKRHIGLD